MTDSSWHRLAERLSHLEAERELGALIDRYGRLLDEHRAETWVDLFCSDAALDFCTQGDLTTIASHMPSAPIVGSCLRFEGSDNLREFALHHDTLHPFPTLHITSNTLFDVSLEEGRASATSNFMRVDYRSGQPQLAFIGCYRDGFTLCPDGKWRFAHRIADILS